MTLINLGIPRPISKTTRARDFKFGTRMHNSNVSKTDKNPEKGRGIGHVTLRIFGILSDISPKPVNISANHCLKFCKLH